MNAYTEPNVGGGALATVTTDYVELAIELNVPEPVEEPEPVGPTIRYLFEDGTDLKTWDGSTWTIIGAGPATETHFTANGMESLASVTAAAVNALNSQTPRVLRYSTLAEPGVNLQMTAVPTDRVIIPTGDINLENTANIDFFTLANTISGAGSVKTVVSFDSGATWFTWAETWAAIEPNVQSIAANGMTPDVLNARTSEDWGTLRGDSTTVRFAYYLSMAASTDTASANTLTAQIDMVGTWKHYKDADWEYTGESALKVTLYANGDYKINYPN
jgi:hypothetical protein